MGDLLDPRTARKISSELGGGKPLSDVDGSRARAEDREAGSGADVRIHDDTLAAELSESLNAVAFTFGRDIFVAGDAPALDTEAGQEMLTHELTHVRQQHGSARIDPQRVSSPDSPAEREAADIARHAPAETAAPAAVHREAVEEEEELALMAADTVHRESDEEEEELMLMPADTVHRQDEEEEGEEIVATMPTDTVHRQDEEEEAASDAESGMTEVAEAEAAPQNPALAALFEGTVGASIRTAHTAMEIDPPDAQQAYSALQQAITAISPLHASYADSDPALQDDIGRMANGLLAIMNAIGPYLGDLQPQSWITRNLGNAVDDIDNVKNRLH